MTPHPADEARRALRAARERASRSASTTTDTSGPCPEPSGEDAAPEGGAVSGGDVVSGGGGTAGAEGPSGGGAAPGEAATPECPSRPGDVAREALRKAVAARRGAEPTADDTTGTQEAPGALGGDAESGSTGVGGVGVDRVPDAAEGTPPPGPAEQEAEPGHPDTRPGDVAREALRAARSAARQVSAEAVSPARGAAPRPRRAPAAGPITGGTAHRAVGPRARDVRGLLADAFKMPTDETPPEEAHEGNSLTHRAGSPEDTTTSDRRPEDTHHPVASPAATIPPDPTDGSAPLDHAGSVESPAQPTLPRTPPSMAAPSRDGDLRRTFPAFAPRPRESDDDGFAATWWGNAWVEALEEGALDAKRLARGRGYAEKGHVDAITVTPGLVLAYVQGSRPRPYRVQVRLRTLDDEDWDRLLHGAAERTGDIAALLDRELPPSLAETGVPLLPGPRELDPRCSCPDSGHPCKHAAALCYQTARLLDADPFVLLLLRGRGERELLEALSRLSAARAARAAQEQGPAPLPGVRATEALADRRLPPLPAPLPVPPHPEQPPVYPATAGGPDPFALDQLATDAAARAHALLATGRDPVGELTLWQDAVRLAAARPGSGLTAGTRGLYSSLATATGRTPADLARAVAAWRQGGLEGLAVLEDPWDPPAGRFDRARPLLLAADLPAFRPSHNRLTHPRGHVQLRLGRDGLWYVYESEPGRDDWWPRGAPDLDPVGALTGLGTPADL
ncbi:hypothetical protein SLCG_6785 [Streptomyces lincolnensis]|uniref:SWIM zinc finger family protein n=1 Tax=Streptomyces lincolnensis TaxID=1915 RepID=UPI000DF63691|nr:SWIM zinc finger family protein [Streptomyces lincolnensis]AXG57940.1 hypothetical protein SLCG_6785 [Streptomyces lincolnensis]